MSERTFFTLRYALPGYIFLLTIFLVNWNKISSLFVNESGAFFTAFLAFLYLLSGSAIGFLISQLWYVFFNYKWFGRYDALSEMNKILKEKLKPKKDVDFHTLQIFSDYIQRLTDHKEMLTYSQRRWDLIHIFGSTMSALFIGFSLGIAYYGWDVGLKTFLTTIKGNFMDIVFVTIFIVIICICLCLGLKRTRQEHSISRLIIVKEVLHKEELPSELSNTFPEYFEASKSEKPNSPELKEEKSSKKTANR